MILVIGRQIVSEKSIVERTFLLASVDRLTGRANIDWGPRVSIGFSRNLWKTFVY